MSRSVIHDFGDQLRWSQDMSLEPSWVAFYRRLWPEMVAAIRVDMNGMLQHSGVDRIILLSNGKQITIDEKKRKTWYGDILLEEWSVWRGTPDNSIVGWTLDRRKQCDYIAYAVIPAKRCWLLPFELLRQAMIWNMDRWKRVPKKYPLDAPNNGYKTRNVGVEWRELKRGLEQQMLRQFGAGQLQLPTTAASDGQLVFSWGDGSTSV